MRRRRPSLAGMLLPVLAGLTILGSLSLTTSTVRACSGPPYDLNRADVIAEGWIERAEISPMPAESGPFHAVQVTMRVVRSLKGDAPTPLVFTDRSSYLPDPFGGSRAFWAGSSGACGVLDADPTGQYALIVFERHDGVLSTALFMGAVFRDGPDDPTLERFRQYLETRLAPGATPRVVPARAGWPDQLTREPSPFMVAGAVLVVAFVAVGGIWLRERSRNA